MGTNTLVKAQICQMHELMNEYMTGCLSIIYLHAKRMEVKTWLQSTTQCMRVVCHVLGFNTLSIKLNAGLHAYTFSSDEMRPQLSWKRRVEAQFLFTVTHVMIVSRRYSLT